MRRARLPHALLLTGARGIGKFRLAREFAAALLCETPLIEGTDGGKACGRCVACNWLGQGSHPDFRLLQPDILSENAESAEAGDGADESGDTPKKGSQQITIDDVRALDDFLRIGTHRQGLRIILIHPAEAMNRNAANSLLKMLEEPPANTLFLLVSSEPSRLLPTVRSRCQSIAVSMPSVTRSTAWLAEQSIDQADKWLALAGGAPLAALSLARAETGGWLDTLTGILLRGDAVQPVAAAGDLEKPVKTNSAGSDDGQNGLRRLVEWMQKWTVDLALAANGQPPRYFIRQAKELCQLACRAEQSKLHAFSRDLAERKIWAGQPLNPRLFLEEIFYRYRLLFVRS